MKTYVMSILTLLIAIGLLLPANGVELVNYNLHKMRGYGKCDIELENAPIQFFNETFDGSHRSGFGVSADGECVIRVRLADAMEIHGINISFFMGNDLGGVDWKLVSIDKEGIPVDTLFSHRTTVIGQADKVKMTKPLKVKEFAFTFSKLLSDLTTAPKGKMDFRIGEIEILVPNGPVMYVATPTEKWLFEPGFYPFDAGVGRDIEWTGWTITADGKRERTVDEVKFSSSDSLVARMNGNIMRTLKGGETTIRAEHPLGFVHEVPVIVHARGKAGIDLDVIRITRLVENEDTGEYEILSRRGKKQYPIRGDNVRYRAETINLGQDTARNITAVWTLDGERVKTERLSGLKPAGPLVGSGEFLTKEKINEIMVHENRVFFELDTEWQTNRQHIGIEVNAEVGTGERGEINPDNNRMVIASDSLCFAYYTIELGYHRFTNAQQEGLKAGGVSPERQADVAARWGKRAKFWHTEPAMLSSSIYDYIYRTCRAWDDQCEISVYPLTPNGITSRFRSKVIIIRDPESAWQAWGEGGGRAVWSDIETDVSWGWIADATFPWDECMNAEYVLKNYTNCDFLFIDYPMLHEASHARGLVDLYIAPMKNNEVSWRDEDGNRLWPDDRNGICDMRSRWTRNGYLVGKSVMMDGSYIDGYSEHSAYAMERMATKRGRFIPANNCSGNASFGEFFNDVAERNILEIWTIDGKPVTGAKIEIAKREDKSGFTNEIPDITGYTDDKGRFNMGNNPVDWPENTAPVPRDMPFATVYYQLHHRGATGSDHSAIRITTKDGKRFYKFLNSFDLNLAYWYKYGIEPKGWPIPSPHPYSSVVIAYTIDSSLSEKEAVMMEHSGEIPTYGYEPEFEDKNRPEYVKIQEWRKAYNIPFDGPSKGDELYYTR